MSADSTSSTPPDEPRPTATQLDGGDLRPASDREFNLGRMLLTGLGLSLCVLLGLWLVAVFYLKANPDRIFERAQIAIKQDDIETIANCAQQLEEFEGYEPHAALLRGLIALRQNVASEAITQLNKALEHEDTRLNAHIMLGDTLTSTWDYAGAVRALQKANQLSPDDYEILKKLYINYVEQGLLYQTLDYIERASAAAPEEYNPYQLKGAIYEDLGLWDEAAEFFRQMLSATKSEADRSERRSSLARCLIAAGRYEDALQELKKSSMDPFIKAYQAYCHAALGQTDQAGEMLREVLQADDAERSARPARIALMIKDGEYEEALELLGEQLDETPDRIDFRRYQITALRESGQQAEADAAQRELDRRLELLKELQQLMASLLTANDPIPVLERLAANARGLERSDVASDWYKSILEIDPDHEQARKGLAELEKLDETE